MKTPQEKYINDPSYHNLVCMLEHMIHTCQFTPSEIREACMLACINYEMYHLRPYRIYATPEVATALKTMEDFRNSQNPFYKSQHGDEVGDLQS